MSNNAETDLHALLDSLTDGEHVKATWAHGAHLTVTEGPVSINGREVWCQWVICSVDGTINPSLTSIEVSRDEEVTVTRDDEKVLHALIDSLEDGERITAEWRDAQGSATLTGPAKSAGDYAGVFGFISFALRWGDRIPHADLRSVTVRRTVVQRWERDDDE